MEGEMGRKIKFVQGSQNFGSDFKTSIPHVM